MSHFDDLEKLKRTTISRQVDRIFENKNSSYADGLEDIGFEWVDDEESQEEAEHYEEEQAIPATLNQEFLVAYLESRLEPDDRVFDVYITETTGKNVNYPLFRRYFKRGSEQLRMLLVYGLSLRPCCRDLLMDLSVLHYHCGILSVLVQAYLTACNNENDSAKFELLARDFYSTTCHDGYDALHELKQFYSLETNKRKVLEQIGEDTNKDTNLRIIF